MSFLGEIKRRKVFQVAAAYAIVGWLLIEVASVLLPTFQAPEWVMRAFSFIVIAGFPLAVILAWAFDLTPQGIKAASEVQISDSPTRLAGQRVNSIIQGSILLAVGFLVVDQYLLEPGADGNTAAVATTLPTSPSSSRVQRFRIILDQVDSIGNTGLSAHVTLSPDSRHLVYAANSQGTTQLYLRTLDQLEARPMPGTEGAEHPFFSPDSEWVAFVSDTTDHKLKKVSVRGGAPQSLADSPLAPGGSWGTNDLIVFSNQGNDGGRTLFRISANGGTPETLIAPTPDGWNQWPHILPGNNAVLFTIRPPGGNAGDGRIAVLSLATGEYKTLVEGGYNGRYAPTGHLVFVRGGALWAAPFDVERLEITGRETPILEGIQADAAVGGAAYAFSDDGMLVYAPGAEVGGLGRRLIWVDREGRDESIPLEPGAYVSPILSPDARSVVFNRGGPGSGDIWTSDLLRGTSSRLTFDGEATTAVWTPDGQRVIFGTYEGIFSRPADGTGQTELLWAGQGLHYPYSVSPDGDRVVFVRSDLSTDIHLLSLNGTARSEPLIQTAFRDDYPAISPDGKWIAYQSSESGSDQIYVRPFPNVGDGKWQISRDGGVKPRWESGGHELFYRGGGGAMIMVVDIETEPALTAGIPRALFTGYGNLGGNNYDPSSVDQRVLMLVSTGSLVSDGGHLIVVDNWFEELKRLAPPE